MDLRSLIGGLVSDPAAQCGPDKATIEKLVAGFEQLLESRGVEPSPFVMLRMHDVITQYRIARRMERTVFDESNEPDAGDIVANAKTNGAKSNGERRSAKADKGARTEIEPLAKAWDRMRKALHDFEAACQTEKTDRAPSLADLATPLLERADGVLEEAIAAENERMRDMHTLESRNRELEAKLSCAD